MPSERTQTPIRRGHDANPAGRVNLRGERLPSSFTMNRRQLTMKDVDGVTT
jgi:hypothetical protein